MDDRVREAVPGDETVHYDATTRKGNAVALTDERLLVARDEVVSVALTDVDEVTVQSLNWFMVVMSLALVGFGLLSVERNPLVGIGFVAVGLANGWVTYRKRGRVAARVGGQTSPLVFYLEDTDRFERTFRDRVAAYERRLATGK